MTKITDLTYTPATQNAEFPLVQDSTTKKMTVSQFRNLQADPVAGDVSGGMLERNVLWGVPSEVEVTDGGSGSFTSPHVQGNIYVAKQQSVPCHSYGAEGNPQNYVGKGMHLKVTQATAGKVTHVEIMNPGQMYKVGDTVTLDGVTTDYSPVDITVPNLDSTIVITVTKVEPFIWGNINNQNYNLGGATNKFITPGYNNSDASDPLASSSQGVPPRMHLDKTAPLYLTETQSPTDIGYSNMDWKTRLEALQGGQDDRIYNAGQQSCWTGPFGSTTAGNLNRTYYQSLSVAIPGSWFVVYAFKTAEGNPYQTPPSYNNGDSAGGNAQFYLHDEDIGTTGNTRWTPVLGDRSFPHYTNIHNLNGKIEEKSGNLGGIAPICAIPPRVSAGRSFTTNYSHSNYDQDHHLTAAPGAPTNILWYYSPKALYSTNSISDTMLSQKLNGSLSVDPAPGKWDAMWSDDPSVQRLGASASNTIYMTKMISASAAIAAQWMNMGWCSSFYLVQASDMLPLTTSFQ